jgi:hypothetical protein
VRRQDRSRDWQLPMQPCTVPPCCCPDETRAGVHAALQMAPRSLQLSANATPCDASTIATPINMQVTSARI